MALGLKGLSKNYSETMSETAREAYKKVVEDSFEKEIQKIPCSRTGDRYNMLVSFVGKMSNSKYPDGKFIFEMFEIESLVFQNCKDTNIKKLIKNFVERR